MRVTVVGGGVIALLTAVECVLGGHQVTVVDQGPIPFSRATSFDQHRILRALHPADPPATAAALRAHRRWLELEELLSTRFYERVGALTVLPPEAAAAGALLLGSAGGEARELTPASLADRYPHLYLDGALGGVLEDQAGVLLADRVLNACVAWLKWQPGIELIEHRAATRVHGDGAAVRLADGRVLRGDAVLVAVGPWSRGLLPPGIAERLVLFRQSLLYCRVPRRQAAAWAATPAVPSLGTRRGAWLIPPVAGTALKITSASVCRTVDEITDYGTEDVFRRQLEAEFADLIPGIGPAWITDAKDAYYMSFADTGGPLLVALGGTGYAYAACGGTSFKFAPLIARALSERLTGADPAPIGIPALDHPLDAAAPVPAAV
ncbi:NAD(P)/FAD-dependent oxidoreductase [Streptomyces sp. NPDC059708]|uniref:NAD(P)/FAD-dependent oxidoreductase n=1 Tax=Streptomyces sp. NPDC059708 TaxID=3346916 RepID=UPI00368EDF1D